MGAKQGTTILPTTVRALGESDAATLNAAFATNPLLAPSAQIYDDGSLGSKMRQSYTDAVMSGKQNGNTLFGEVDMDYGKGDDADKGKFGEGAGQAANAYVPNVASPGEGNGANATSQPALASPLDQYGHSGDLGAVTSVKGSSKAQGAFSLTNLPARGKSS